MDGLNYRFIFQREKVVTNNKGGKFLAFTTFFIPRKVLNGQIFPQSFIYFVLSREQLGLKMIHSKPPYQFFLKRSLEQKLDSRIRCLAPTLLNVDINGGPEGLTPSGHSIIICE